MRSGDITGVTGDTRVDLVLLLKIPKILSISIISQTSNLFLTA